MKALTAVNDGDMKDIVESLSTDECDNLMKYLYRALGQADSCGSMLKWHAQVVTHAGLGPIVRSLSDRKTV